MHRGPEPCEKGRRISPFRGGSKMPANFCLEQYEINVDTVIRNAKPPCLYEF
ncbi:MAG: hypothetical protein ACI9MR_001820, partial [Myxococcota bacterium]